MEIDSLVHVRHPTRLSICRACRFASSTPLANHLVPAATESRTAVLGGMASLLHDASFPSPHLSVSLVSSAMLVPVRRSELAKSFALPSVIFARSCGFLGLLRHRIFENRSHSLETWMDDRFSGGTLVVLAAKLWLLSAGLRCSCHLFFPSDQTIGSGPEANASAFLFPIRFRLFGLLLC